MTTDSEEMLDQLLLALDGTSQQGRSLAALDPDGLSIDERTSADLLTRVQKIADALPYYEATAGTETPVEAGTWTAFFEHPSLTIQDMVAYVEHPERFGEEERRWLGRPHFALLLAFVELLGESRRELGGFTRRHLDHFYRDLLGVKPLPPRADRVALALRLAKNAAKLHLPAGTAFEAGRDSAGVPQIYLSERELVVGRAEIAELRSLFVDREIVDLEDVQDNSKLTTVPEVLLAKMQLALGDPKPGDSIPTYSHLVINADFISKLDAPLNFARNHLKLEHHELRDLVHWLKRRNAGYEWTQIHGVLGLDERHLAELGANQRDYHKCMEKAASIMTGNSITFNFENDANALVTSFDDLYGITNVAAQSYLERVLGTDLVEDFWQKLNNSMPLKKRSDAEWRQINGILERMAQRRSERAAWQFPVTFTPTDFEQNLQTVLGLTDSGPWPWGIGADQSPLIEYDKQLRLREKHFSMPVERLTRLAQLLTPPQESTNGTNSANKSQVKDWSWVDRILADAHQEKQLTKRRAELWPAPAPLPGAAEKPAFQTLLSVVVPDLSGTFALADTNATLTRDGRLSETQFERLLQFESQFAAPNELRRVEWEEVLMLVELAARNMKQVNLSLPRSMHWHHLYEWSDASSCLAKTGDPLIWKTFGARPPQVESAAPTALMGLELRSSALGLDGGSSERRLDLRLTLAPVGGTQAPEGVLPAQAWLVELSSPKGWLPPDTVAPPTVSWANQTLTISFALGPNAPALTALPGAALPALRLLIKPYWDEGNNRWTSAAELFALWTIASVHLDVTVLGLADVQLQAEDRPLDPKKPFEPFGSQPVSGARLYLGHPELASDSLSSLTLNLEWMGKPSSLATHYANYPTPTPSVGTLKVLPRYHDGGVEYALNALALFAAADPEIDPEPNAQALVLTRPNNILQRQTWMPGRDLRETGRYLSLELDGDLGHAAYPSQVALKAAQLAHDIAKDLINSNSNPVSKYHLKPPYTPLLKKLSVDYRAQVSLDFSASSVSSSPAPGELLYVHPFGTSPVPNEAPSLLPSYEHSGELYLGLTGVSAPEKLALFLQLAEGTSDPDKAHPRVRWSCLSANQWQDLPLISDGTNGLLHSGLVEVSLPPVEPSQLLPHDRYWLRLSVVDRPAGVCDSIDILTQAAVVRFEDRNNASDHYERPLAPASISRLLQADARIARVEQPFASFGGRPAEQPAAVDQRTSERLRHKQRAVSAWDYERLVLQEFPQIYKAKCIPASASEPGRVTLIVIPDQRQAPSLDPIAPQAAADLLAAIAAYLQARAPGSAKISVRNPDYVAVELRLTVKFMAEQDAAYAQARLNHDLVRYLSPWAYDEGAELVIGGQLHANSILDFVDRLDYVDYVAGLKFFQSGEAGPILDGFQTTKPDQVLVSATQHHIDLVRSDGYVQAEFTGINYMKIELDFQVA